MTTIFYQSANGDLDYKIDWSAWLGDDTISSATVVATAPLTIHSQANNTKEVFVWLNSEACVIGSALPVVCEIVTVNGRRESRTFYISIIE